MGCPKPPMKTQNVNTYNAVYHNSLSVAVSPRRDHSPQPRSPCVISMDHHHSSTTTTQSSLPSYSTAASILVSRSSMSPQQSFTHHQPFVGRGPQLGSTNSNSTTTSYVNTSDLCDRTLTILKEAGCVLHHAQLCELFDGHGDSAKSTFDAVDRFVDDLSGSEARRALTALLHAVAASSTLPKPPTLCAIATAPFVDSKSPRRNSSLGSMNSRHEGSPKDGGGRNPHHALMRPSFAVENDPNAFSTSSNVPPMSPFNFSTQSMQITPGAASDAASLTFRAKNRRESVESFESSCIPTKVRSVRSIERSVDAEGYKVINDYTVLGMLGKGTSGKVKQVVHHETGESRAIKIVKRSMVKKIQGPHGIDRLRKEVAIMKKLNHKHIIKLYEVIDDPGSDKMYFVMQFVAKGEVLPGADELQHFAETGGTSSPLSNGACRCKPLVEETVARYIRQAASGLIYLHNHGIVHFDIKPQNILRDQEDNVVLADFGVSELMKSENSNMVESLGLGTPAYMAPEVCRGDRMVDGEAVDTWSLGVTAFAMLYAKMPFQGRSLRDLFFNIQSFALTYPPEATAVQRDFFDHIFVEAPQRWSLRELRRHAFLSNMEGSMMHSLSRAPDEDENTTTIVPRREGFLHRVFAISEGDIESAISRLVSPVFGEMGEVISSCSSESRSPSISNDSYSRAQSPRMGLMPPSAAVPPADFSASDMALPNPRAAMARCGGPPAEKEVISPPLSRYSSISLGSYGHALADDAHRTRRETQVMRESSAN